MYDTKDYKEVKKGDDPDYTFTILYQNVIDTNYTLKEVYLDSNYLDLLGKHFYFKGNLNGPFSTYIEGKVFMKGFYKHGRKHGERLTYDEGKITKRAYFLDGKKSGIWEEYKNAKLIKKTFYDTKGNLIKEISF